MCNEFDRLIDKFSKGDQIFISKGYAGHLTVKAAKFGCRVVVCESENYETVVKNVINNKVGNTVIVLKQDVLDTLKELVQERHL